VDRRSFLKTSALGGTAAAATTLAAPAIAQGNRTLTMVTSVPDGFAIFDDAANYAARAITEMTDGQITINKMPAGSLVGAFEVFDAVTAGQADMYHSADYYFVGQHPGYAFFTAVPFGMTAQELVNWYYHDGGHELHDELGQIFGLKSFLAGNTGAQAGGWFAKEINSPEDFQGLKFRMPGLGGQTVSKLGASVQTLPASEIYQALSSGALDATEWIGPYNDLALGFYQVCRYYYAHGYHEPGANLQLMINERAWQSLTPDLQAIVRTAAQAATGDMLAEYNARSGPALRTLVRDHGVVVRGLPEEVLMACGEKSNEVLNEIYAADTSPQRIVRRIIEDFLAFRKEIIPWTRIGEQAYLNARRLPFEFRLRQ